MIIAFLRLGTLWLVLGGEGNMGRNVAQEGEKGGGGAGSGGRELIRTVERSCGLGVGSVTK